MRARDIIGLVIALLLAISVAFLTRYFLTEEDKKTETIVKEVPAKMSKILVAGKDLSEGELIQQEDLRWQDWPVNAITPQYVREGSVTLESLQGSIVKEPLHVGEPINLKDLVQTDEGGVLAAILDPGMRAIAINVNPQSALSGLIIPGDMVDLILSKKAGSQGGISTVKSTTILSNIKVLAMDVNLKSKPELPEKQPRVAVLQVTPDQAETVMAAAKEGSLSLSLQSLGKGEIQACVGEDCEEKIDDSTILIIRGSQKEEVNVQDGY